MQDINADSLSERNDYNNSFFAASVVHDLKTPLNAQLIVLRQIYNEKFGRLNSLQKEMLLEIINSSLYMKTLLTSFFNIYKLENQEFKLNKKHVNIDKLLESCINELMPCFSENSIIVNYINSSSDNVSYCDEFYMRRVFENLLSNALNYSNKNSSIKIIFSDTSLCSIFKFQSTGIPIPDKVKEHIFDKNITGVHKKSGAGIGLYFCKKVIEAHNGEIKLSTKNFDTEFSVSIPKQ